MRTAAILIAMLIVSPALADIALVKNGKSDCVILIPPDATPAEKRGAGDLQKYIKLMSGADFPIDTKPRPMLALAIALEPAAGSLAPEGFVLRTDVNKILIQGDRSRGTLYGCTAFLEKLGVRFLTPKITRVPKAPTITLPEFNETHAPAFEYREPFFFEAFDKEWAAHIRSNGAHTKADASTGGKVTYAEFVHTFDSLVPQKLYDAHPEYFPLINGARAKGYVQRCLTNPDVLKLTVEGVRRAFEKNPDATIMSVSQNDCGSWCTCDQCNAIVTKYGGNQSGVYIWFVNQVAEQIEKTHPTKLIDTLAYQFTEAPPTGIAPRKNVRVRLCPISCCEAHPYESCAAPANKAFVANLAAWSKLTDTLYIWHYNTDFAHYLMPFPDFNQFPDAARLYKRSGVKGVFFQGAYAPGGGGSDAELRSYVMAKLLWDPSLDASALLDEWMTGVYGPAAKPMRAWFDALQARMKDPNRHLTIYQPPDANLFPPELVAQGDQLFDEAQALTKDDSLASEYVAKSRLWLRYVKLMLAPKADDAFKQFMADVRKIGVTQMREGQPIDAWEAEFIKSHSPK